MSSVIAAAILGLLFGAGVLLMVRAANAPTVSLRALRESLDQPGVSVADRAAEPSGPVESWQETFGSQVIERLARVGFGDDNETTKLLRAAGRTPAQHAYERVMLATVAFLMPVVWLLVMASVFTWSPSLPVIALALVALTIGGFFFPALTLRSEAEARRERFRQGLSAYIDLVVILTVGGRAVNESLERAAMAGDGWVFDEIRTALRRGQFVGQKPWHSLAQLGRDLGVRELVETAATFELAGDRAGADLIQTLVVRSDSMRHAVSSRFEAEAERKTEKMVIPLALLVAGLSIFAGYGAFKAGSDVIAPSEQSQVEPN